MGTASGIDLGGRIRHVRRSVLAVALSLAMIASGLTGFAPAAAVTDEDPDFEVTTHDLEFIIRQIQISEAHAQAEATGDDEYSLVCDDPNVDLSRYFPYGDEVMTCVPHPRLPWGLRTVTGEHNNLFPDREQFGAGGNVFPRLVDPLFRDADPVPPVTAPDEARPAGTPTTYDQTDGYVYDASPRLISNLIADQTTGNPAAVEAAGNVDGSIVDGNSTVSFTEAWVEYNEDDAALDYGTTTTHAVAASPENLALRTEGSAIYIEEAGGSVEFTITDGFEWIGNRSSGRGIAEVYIDGVLYATVDQYHVDDTPGQTLAHATGLGPIEKTVRIVNTGDVGAGSVARTEIDAIRVRSVEYSGGVQVATELNEDDAALTYTVDGDPTPVGDPTGRTEGSAGYIEEAGGAVEFSFTDGFRWIGNTAPARGTAHVFINGLHVAEVDQHNATMVPGQEHFTIDGLGPEEKFARIVNVGGTTPTGHPARTEIDAITLFSLEAETGTGNIFIPDVAPDEGLSASFTGWFTLFGQFFDHGLDLVEKGGNGDVIVPLRPDDPLYVEGASTNFLTLTRATRHGDGDDHLNRTTPFVDQNQTYTSHPSHQVFLREYEMVDGVPVPTGHLLDAPDDQGGGLATWGDIKHQAATKLGIALDHEDIHAVPLLATDPYGRFIPGDNGLPQLVVEGTAGNELVEGDLGSPVATDGLDAGHAFLDDIAHAAVPGRIATHGPTAGQVIAHDADLLADHYITGDGRGNENLGLTAVHHVFHSEHNRLADDIHGILTADGNEALLEQYEAATFWDYGERLFQAARYVTEMQYQHMVFEEFARTISPEIDVQPLNETAYHDSLDASIAAEFAHVTYRFGHSMLTETVDRVGFGTDEQMPLLDAFLAPRQFLQDASGQPLTADQGAAAVIQGMTRQTGNMIDEFVTETLRNNLLGLPLDLATINIARARETGSPTLQAARQAFYDETLDASLEPYADWNEFRLALKHRASVVNFIAAYGIHPSLDRSMDATGQPVMTIDELRANAQALVTDDPETSAFMNLPAAESGLNDVDFWMGGLAENLSVFGGFLGSTFNHVFERQLEKLQNGDRFYYLNRNQGLNLFHQLENNSFTELILRNTDADNLHANVFANPNTVYDLSEVVDDGEGGTCEIGALPEGLSSIAGTIRYDGADHIVLHGSECDDNLVAGLGDDSVWGHGGNDRIEGGEGNDTLHGGSGDDIIQDEFGDDTIHAGSGNDAVNGGAGADLMFGGPGKDFILHNSGVGVTSFAGSGDDFARGGTDFDALAGNEGDDWLEGNEGHDLLQGDNSLTFQNDLFGGHDVLIGGRGNDDHDAEGGDDIMLNNGIDRHAGMLGFDWVSHQHDPNPVNSDLDIAIYQPHSVVLMNSRYFSIEGLSGWHGDDVLRGTSDRKDQPFEDGAGNELTESHLTRTDGLLALLSSEGEDGQYAAGFMATNEANNILLGGNGSDLIEGRAGDDYIDGKSWLRVAIEWRDGDTVIERRDSMQPFQARVFNGTIDPADLHIVREIVAPDAAGFAACDTAEYDDVRGNYTVTDNGDGTWTVAHTDGPENDDLGEDAIGGDGTDILRHIDRLMFADETQNLTTACGGNVLAAGTATFSTASPVVGEPITATPVVTDPDGVPQDPAAFTFAWQFQSGDGWQPAGDSDGTDTFVPTVSESGSLLRVIITFTDDAGAMESVVSDPTENPVGEAAPPPATVPAAPTIGAATAGDGQATVTWVQPADDGGSVITGYEIEVIDVDDTTGNPTVTGVGVGEQHTVEGLINGRTYQFQVAAINAEGVSSLSEVSNSVTPQAADTQQQQDPPLEQNPPANPPLQENPPVLEQQITSFADVPEGSTFADHIAILAETGVTTGCSDDPPSFCPTEDVTRGQMATFIVNAFEASGDPLPEPPGGVGTFDDVLATNAHAENIAKIAAAGITTGYGDGSTFGPGDEVTREQMATFLARALDLAEPMSEDPAFPFGDVDPGNTHYSNIHRIYIAGITTGTSATTYSPTEFVTREQMAAFLVRAFALEDVVANGADA